MKKLIAFMALLSATLLTIAHAQEPAPVSFRNLVSVGDSLAAGFQNNSLNAAGQNHSYPAFFARQAGTFLFQALITQPGIPNELTLVDPGPPPVIESRPGPAGTRVFPLIVPQNLAIPGQRVADALLTRPSLPLDSLEDVILGVPILLIPQLGIPPLSQVELAFVLQPTMTLFWLGNNDLLGAVVGGDPSLITPTEAFQAGYATAVGTILASGSSIIVANLPDPTRVPFLISAQQVAALAGAPLAAIGPLLGIAEGDFVTAPGLTLASLILTGQLPGPLPDNVVLTAEEVLSVRASVDAFNSFIQQLSQAMGFPVVDINSLFNDIDENGIEVGDRILTTGFLGGIFSIDGIHPTRTGQALIANAFIETANAAFGRNIPPVDVAAVAAGDPLVLFSAGPPPQAVMSMDLEYFERLSMLFRDHDPGLLDSGGAPDLSFLRGLRLAPGPAAPSVAPKSGIGKRLPAGGLH